MLKLINKFAWVAILLLMIAMLVASLGGINKPERIALNQVAPKIIEGNVQKIELTDDILSITLQDNTVVTAKKEPNSNAIETLKNLGVTTDHLQNITFEVKESPASNMFWGVIFPVIFPIIIISVLFLFFIRKLTAGANQAISFGKSNIRLFTNLKEKISFKDVAGLKEPKQELEEVVDFLKNPKKYHNLGAKIPRGVLLMGPPGTGKTLLARAVAGEAGVPFFHISASEFVEMFVGVGASRTRDAFKTAKAAAPSILFIDEVDAIGRERGAGLGGGHDEREQTLNQILVEMDGFDREEKVIVLAATNRPDVLDPALLRPGRFDRRVMIDLPDINEREEILKIHSRNKPISKEANLNKIAIRTPGFSGADLENLINESAILAAQKNLNEISQDIIYDSIEKVILGPARKSRIISDKEKKITAIHEAGHAVVSAAIPDSDPIQKISIVSRGRAGGYTMRLPSEEMRLKTKNQFIADMTMLVSGHAAEKEFFGDISTGASDDLKRASEISRAIVTKYGMSDKLGPMTFGNTEETIFLGRDMTTDKNYSNAIAEEIDKEMRKFIDLSYSAAQATIKKYKQAIIKVADELIKKEVLEQEDFNTIMNEFGILNTKQKLKTIKK